MATVSRRTGVRMRRWSKKEYYRLGDLGFFRGQRVELLKGLIVVQSRQSPLHACSVSLVFDALRKVFGAGHWVRPLFPLDLGRNTEPEPDICVVVGSRQQYMHAHPTAAVLIVEVSDTTLSFDRGRKGSLYAAAGVADYWIVNLVARQIEVYRNPVPDPSQPYGSRYSSQTIVVPPDTLTPLALPQAAIPAADLLP